MIVFKILGWILLVILILLIVLLHFSVTINIHAGRDGFIVKAKYLFLTLYPRKKKAEETDGEDDAFDVLSDELTDEQLMQGLTAEQESALTEQAAKPEAKDESKPESKEESKKEDTKPADKKDDKKKKESKKEDSAHGSESADAVSPDEDTEEEEEKEDKPGLREKIAGLRRKYEKLKPYIPMSWKWFRRLLRAVRIRIDDLWADVGRDDAHEAAIFYGSIQAFISSLLATFAEWFTLKVRKWNVNCRFAQNVIDGGADISVRVRPSTLIGLAVCFAVNFVFIWIKRKIAAKKAVKKAKQADNGAAPAA